jgi:hypothetical protein
MEFRFQCLSAAVTAERPIRGQHLHFLSPIQGFCAEPNVNLLIINNNTNRSAKNSTYYEQLDGCVEGAGVLVKTKGGVASQSLEITVAACTVLTPLLCVMYIFSFIQTREMYRPDAPLASESSNI